VKEDRSPAAKEASKVIRWNLHTHTTESDGDLSIGSLVRQAASEDLLGIAVTDHFPYPYRGPETVDWKVSREQLDQRLKRLEVLRANEDHLVILRGVEVEFTEPLSLLEGALRGLEVDFVLGGVHVLDRWMVDWSEAEFLRAEEFFGSLKTAILRYFEAAAELAESGLVDCLAHIDLVKKYNHRQRHFKQNSSWYVDAAVACLERVAEAGVAIELNTSGLRKPVEEMYPVGWLLRRAAELGIEVTVGTDLHRADEGVTAGLDQAELALREAGYESYLIFKDRKRREVELGGRR